MNKELFNQVLDLKEIIYDLPEVKEYLKLKKAINNSKSLQSLDKKIKYLKKCHMSDEEKNEYNFLLNEYNSNAIIQNYLEASRNLKNVLFEIKNELEL